MTPHYAIHGEIGDGDARAEPLGNFLRANRGPVTVTINSVGGHAHEGGAMLGELERHGHATCIVEGMAASAASLLMMGGRTVVLHPAAMVMIHEPSGLSYGPAEAHRYAAGVLDKMTLVYAEAYARLTGNPLELVRKWMADETWLNAEEALALNFCDRIEGAEATVAFAAYDYSKFRHAPAQLVQLARSKGWVSGSPAKQKGTQDA
jgi:ATP-dependent protease ClpP protease subunit